MEFTLDCEHDKNEEKYTLLENRISELEANINIKNNNYVIITKHIDKIVDYINIHTEDLKTNKLYCNNLLKKINELSNIVGHVHTAQHDKINNIITTYNKMKDIINSRDEELIKLKNKQKQHEDQILELQVLIEKQKQQDSEIFEIRRIIQTLKNPEETNINIMKKDKRKINTIDNDYIDQLKIAKKMSKPWTKDMSKYISITLVNNKWRWTTPIFGDKHVNFKTKEDAEKYYENIIAKYNIDPIYITRNGYQN
jgi:chromosome segregation ATPase